MFASEDSPVSLAVIAECPLLNTLESEFSVCWSQISPFRSAMTMGGSFAMMMSVAQGLRACLND